MSFLGLVKTLNTYTPWISQTSATLQKLTHLTTNFSWDKQTQQEFEEVKAIMANKLKITAFDSKKDIHLFCDAAQSGGLGFVLLQPSGNKAQPYHLIQAGSTHLTDVQSRYSTYQISN